MVDSYTVEPTRVVDCGNRKQQAAVSLDEPTEAVVVQADGTIEEIYEGTGDAHLPLEAMAGLRASSRR